MGPSLKSILHTSTPGNVKQSLGGVGRNVAEAAWRTGASQVKLVSVVGDDLAGASVKQGMATIGMDTNYIQTLKNQPTAVNIHKNRMNCAFFLTEVGCRSITPCTPMMDNWWQPWRI